MSTPRTRHNRNNAPQTNQNPKNPLAVQICVVVFLSIAFCITSVFVNKSYPGTLPNRTIPLTILLTVVVLIFVVVRFVIKQYKMLKNTYQNLEQGMQQAAMYGSQQIDFVEYPTNAQQGYPGYNQNFPQQGYPGYNQNFPQQGYPQYGQNVPPLPNQTHTQRQRNRRSPYKKFSFKLRLVIAILLTGLTIYSEPVINSVLQDIDDEKDVYTYTCTDSIVTDTVTVEVSTEDEDGGTMDYTEHYCNIDYEYGGKQYSERIDFPGNVNSGDYLKIYLNKENPSEVYAKSNFHARVEFLLIPIFILSQFLKIYWLIEILVLIIYILKKGLRRT